MVNYSYTCQNCGKEYIPKRRKIQKYCSNSCRSRAFFLRNPPTNLSTPDLKTKEPTQIDQMSLAGVGNAAAGAAIVKVVQHFITPEANKPATKGDLKNLESRLTKKYYPVKNQPTNAFGQFPFFDIEQEKIVYFAREQFWKLK